MPRIVLVADDSPTIQKRAVGILKGEGFEVETVSNGVAAIKRLTVLHPMVVLADVSMPGRDGYEVCDFIKKSTEFSHVPVLLVASDMEPYDDARGAEVRADGIIKKPFEASELLSLVVRFAAQFEAETSKLAAPIPTPEVPERTREFVVSSLHPDDVPASVQHSAPQHTADHAISLGTLDDVPTLVQHSAPDFSEVSEGVAFTEHSAEEPEGSSSASHEAESGTPHPAPPAPAETVFDLGSPQEFADIFPGPEAHTVSVVDTPLVGEEPPASSSLAPSVEPPLERTPSFLEGMEAVTAEAAYIEELPAQNPEPLGATDPLHTLIFSAPAAIAEPVWKDETVVPPPEAEPVASTAGEPQAEVEPRGASPEKPLAPPLDPLNATPSLGATSLDGFSLDDAAAGHVHFASDVAAYPLAEPAPSEVSPKEAASADAPVEYTLAEASPGEVAPEEITPPVAPVEEAPEKAAPSEVPTQEIAGVVVPAEYAQAEASAANYATAELASALAAAEPAPIESADVDVAPSVAHAEYASGESASADVAVESLDRTVAPVDYAPMKPVPAEATQDVVAHLTPTEETPATGSALPEAAVDVAPAEIPPPEPPAEFETPVNTPQISAPPSAFPWDMFYSIVRKVVAKMSPPPLPKEAVEEMTKRLAEEIATEIISESSRPPE